MALFRRRDSETVAPPPTGEIPPDPQAFAPIPPPAPYQPVDCGTGLGPEDHLSVQKLWAADIGDEKTKPPTRRRRYADDTEYLRDLSTAAQDGIGHTHEGFDQKAVQAPDPRWFGVDPNLGKRPDDQVRNPDKFTYFRPYEQDVARAWNDAVHPREHPDILNDRHIRQGNYAIRSWRSTQRFDPTSGETYDRTPAANIARVAEYNATSTIRRTFRL